MSPQDRPTLTDPIFMAAWPGMGLVAFKAVAYLVQKLKAVPLETVPAEDRFSLGAISVQDGIADAAALPESRFFTHHSPPQRDLLLFLGAEQPVSGKEWSFANEILEIAESYGAKLLFTFAAMPTRIDHRQAPNVWGVATNAELRKNLQSHELRILTEGSISGLNGVLLGVAKQRGWGGYCLLGEIPLYATQMENPRSSWAVLQKASSLVDITVDLEDLRIAGAATSAQLDVIFKRLADKRDAQEQEDEAPDEEDEGSESEPVLN